MSLFLILNSYNCSYNSEAYSELSHTSKIDVGLGSQCSSVIAMRYCLVMSVYYKNDFVDC